MADGIGRIGGNNYGYSFGFSRQGEESSERQDAGTVVNNVEVTPLDPSKVMEYMTSNNVFVALPDAPKVGVLDDATKGRIADSMKDFELFMSVATDEVGENLALLLADEYIQI